METSDRNSDGLACYRVIYERMSRVWRIVGPPWKVWLRFERSPGPNITTENRVSH